MCKRRVKSVLLYKQWYLLDEVQVKYSVTLKKRKKYTKIMKKINNYKMRNDTKLKKNK